MTEETKVQFRSEGDPAFPADTENENSADSPSDETKAENGESSDAGDKKPDADKDIPFDQHPAWKDREKKWDDRFNEQETRHQEDLKSIREEFGTARKDNAGQVKIPSWFGGTQEQWDSYRADRDTELKQAEERAYERVTKAKTQEESAVAEATAYMQTEMSTIASDKGMNPNGLKVDPNRLLKIVMETDGGLVDPNGRWNYKAGWRILRAQLESEKAGKGDRKTVAGAVGSETKPETAPKTYKTGADFRKSKPW